MGYCDGVLNTTNRSAPLLARFDAWLSPADAPRNADLIFVLAGRVHRKEYALQLYREGLAPRILFSVGRFEIRRFSKMPLPVPLDLLKLAQDVPPPQRHYFVFFQGQEAQVEHVPPGRFGTLTEVSRLSRWLGEKPDIRSALIISSGTHLRRIRMCCQPLLNPKTELAFLAAPISLHEQPISATAEHQEVQTESRIDVAGGSLNEDLLELFKLGIYWVLLKTR
jgi:uncharacterized SAM-binding protein YcdF (DUF218 family)